MEEWKYSSSIHYLRIRWRRMVSFTSLPLYPRRKTELLSFGEEATWAPEPICTLWSRENQVHMPGIEPHSFNP
jgi:hypothetical protein